MNKKAEEIGLINTHFVTPHGLDNEDHYSTSYDLAILTDYALENKIFSKIVCTKNITININGISTNINNTNELLGYLNGVDGVKTGFTNGAGRCLVTSCTRNQNQIITVVLGCDTKKDRTKDSIKLIEYAYSNYTRINLEEMIKDEFENWKQINLNRVNINKAKNRQDFDLKLEEIDKKIIVIKNNDVKDIKIDINVIYNYEAPIKKNTKIGNIIVKRNKEIIESVNIFSEKEIERKDIFYYLRRILTLYN